jgi:hypothetical protein
MVTVVSGAPAISRAIMDVASSSQYFHVVSTANGGDFSQAFWNCCGATPTLRQSVGVASGAATENQGIAVFDSSPTLEYVTGIATGPAANNLGVLVTGATSAPNLRQVACRGIGAGNINWGCLSNVGAQPTMAGIDAFGFGGGTARGVEDDSVGAGASLSDVRAVASGASSENSGLKINNCSPRVVDVEGSANGDGSSGVYGLLVIDGSPDVSHATLTAGGASLGIMAGVYLSGVASDPALSHVTASGNFSGTGGGAYGLYTNAGGSPTIRDSEFSAVGQSFSIGAYATQGVSLVNVSANGAGAGFNYGGAVQNNPATARFINSRLTASGGSGSAGLQVGGPGTVHVDRSTVSGGLSIININNATIRVAVSQLVNPVNNGGGGTLSCLSSYNGAYNPLNAICQ